VEEWDWRYLDARQRALAGVDPSALRPYLPFEAVLDGLWRLSATVFGVRVEPRPERAAWHPDVRAYDLVDQVSGATIAQLFVDPFVRDGKAGGAYADILDPGDAGGGNGAPQPRVLLLGTNAPAVGDGPSTLGFQEIDMIFHEYGHVLDFALDSSPWWPIREDWLEFDWIEAPSTFLGRWGHRPEVMRTFARHVDTGDPIPDEVFDALARLDKVNTGFKAMRFLSMGRLDLRLHGADPIPAGDADREAWAIRLIPFVEGTSFLGTFLHLLAGYSAATYGFLWDTALRDDLFAGFGPDLLSPESGARYRRAILEAPWTRPPLDCVTDFLGRPWSSEAFLERSGS
jgi:Zn-dependent oligopeptidase